MNRSALLRNVFLSFTLTCGFAGHSFAAKPAASARAGLVASSFPNTKKALSSRTIKGKANRAAVAAAARSIGDMAAVRPEQIATLRAVVNDPALREMLPRMDAELAAIAAAVPDVVEKLGVRPAFAASKIAIDELRADPLAVSGLKKLGAHMTAAAKGDAKAYGQTIAAKLAVRHPSVMMRLVKTFQAEDVTPQLAMRLATNPDMMTISKSAASIIADAAGLDAGEKIAVVQRVKAVSAPMLEIGVRMMMNRELIDATADKIGPNVAALRTHGDKVLAYLFSQHPDASDVLAAVATQLQGKTAETPGMKELSAQLNANPHLVAVLAAVSKDLGALKAKN